MEREFCRYFQELFTSSNPSLPQIELALRDMQPKVTEEMNTQLGEPFKVEEITNALTQMCPTKAPGPDGLPAAFFQKHWQSVREGLITTCLHILNHQGNPATINHTYIALIPKVPKPRKVSEYRPISLCNVVYRIITKAIANRMKPILSQIISPTQSAFIPNRLITDNVIIGYECLHKIRHSKGKRNGLVALKLVISKAYDRVEWLFLKQAMEKLGFSSKWVELIMRCITSASFSIIINGVPRDLIQPERGLREGCPLSPYLFIICDEIFSSLLARAEEKQLIRGLRFSKEVTISHLLFADDNLIFTWASVAECKHLKEIFDCYTNTSGQLFNFEKSSMFLSGKVTEAQVNVIRGIFKLKVVSKFERYLGLPAMIGKKRTSFFNEVKLKVLSKISGWHHKMFSSGGREILIKAAAQAVPAYAMSIFKIPKGLCDDIQRAIARFWWGSKEDKRGIHWARWDKLSHAKSRGGMGVRDFSCFNQALVAKQGWRVIQSPNSLVSKVLQARYFKNSNFLSASLGSNPSFIWRSILWGREVIKRGIRWRVGNGKKISVYEDNWLPRPDAFKPISPPALPKDSVVADLLNDMNQWDEDKLNHYFMHEDTAVILKIPLPNGQAGNEILWHFDKRGEFSVKSGYQLALKLKFPEASSNSTSSSNQWKILWALDLPEKIKIFMWRALKDLLPSAENLWKRKVLQEPICQRCRREVETISHALLTCKAAKKVWLLAPFTLQNPREPPKDMLGIFQKLENRLRKDKLELWVTYCWAVWFSRNKLIFEGKGMAPEISATKAESTLAAYQRVRIPTH